MDVVHRPTHLKLEQGKGIKGVWLPATPHLVVGDVKTWADIARVESISVPAYWFDKNGCDTPVNAPPTEGEKVLLVLHGGAYAMQSAHPSDTSASITRGILEHAGPSVRRALAVEYRLSNAPTSPHAFPFPAALLDAIAAYNYLINEVGFTSENIIVEGDSAGGNLALALVRYLVENLQTSSGTVIPRPPAALMLLSPWVDLHPDMTDRESSMHTNAASDLVGALIPPDGRAVVNFLGPHGTSAAWTNPYISPASTHPSMPPVSFAGFPRTFILNGGAEVLRDQIRVLRDRMQACSGVSVAYAEFQDAWHDFVVWEDFEPERSEALAMIEEWVCE